MEDTPMEAQLLETRKHEIIVNDDGTQSDARPRAFPLWNSASCQLPSYRDDLRRPHPMGFVADE